MTAEQAEALRKLELEAEEKRKVAEARAQSAATANT